MADEIPYEVRSGDNAKWTVPLVGYSGYAAVYTIDDGAGNSDTVTGTPDPANAESFDFDLTAAASGALPVGRYGWSLRVSLGGEVCTIETGFLEIRDPVATADSHSRKMLAAIRATLESRATKDQQSYSIAGRALVRIPFEELRTYEAEYKGRVEAEDRAELRKRGRGQSNQVVTRLQ